MARMRTFLFLGLPALVSPFAAPLAHSSSSSSSSHAQRRAFFASVSVSAASSSSSSTESGGGGSSPGGGAPPPTAPKLPSWSLPDGQIDSARVPPGFRAGFVSILGQPNAGKSTLMNRLVGDRLSITSPKAQTTRHRIMGVCSGEGYQLVYSDTPGLLAPEYKMHEAMMASVRLSLSDADVLLAVVDVTEEGNGMGAAAARGEGGGGEGGGASPPSPPSDDDVVVDANLLAIVSRAHQPVIVAVNKIDHHHANGEDAVAKVVAQWERALAENTDGPPSTTPAAVVCPVSALTGDGCDRLLVALQDALPLSPPLYHADTLTDKPEKFFAAEAIREQIFHLYGKEIPYSCEVQVKAFKDSDKILKITAVVYVSRDSQKGIVVGKGGQAVKRLGSAARAVLEAFFRKPVFLDLSVQVNKNWRASEASLKGYGYGE